MSRTPIGEAAMSDAERQQRRGNKAKALRDAAPKPPAQFHDPERAHAARSHTLTRWEAE